MLTLFDVMVWRHAGLGPAAVLPGSIWESHTEPASWVLAGAQGHDLY